MITSHQSNYMILRFMKQSARRIGRSVGLARTARGNGAELASTWYDDAYRTKDAYKQPFFLSPYYSLWTVIVDRLHRYGARRLLDVGCGPGQFAELVRDWGFEHYTGIDFSPQAIQMARSVVPEFDFVVADARCANSYRTIDYDAIVCTEVLEHIEDDFGVLSCFRPDAPCLCTVPNFPYESHVRHFRSTTEVMDRYGGFFEALTVTRIKGTSGRDVQYFLMDGLRNSYTARADRSEGTV
jgi:SAM-dependent methyltransferase